MAYTVLLRLDLAGACPVIVRDDNGPLLTEEGVRWRLVAEADDHGEAIRAVEALARRY